MHPILAVAASTTKKRVELVVKESATGTTQGDSVVVSLRYQTETKSTHAVLYSQGTAVTMTALHVARDAILGLLSNRDLLSVQLTHAHGGMSDEEFDTLVDEHLDAAPRFDEQRVATMAVYLAGLVPEKFDADLVSIAARCSLEEASKAIRTATDHLDTILPEHSAALPYTLSK